MNSVSGKKTLMSFIITVCLNLMVYRVYAGGAFIYRFPTKRGIDSKAITVVGVLRQYIVKEDDTLLDIARRFDLGFYEIATLYPKMDPWLPPVGKKLLIPTSWVIPDTKFYGIVINIPEMRLYLYLKPISMVTSFPIGIGDYGSTTPLGVFTVIGKRVNPAWEVPRSLQKKYGMKIMPPGSENPLGTHCLNLSPGMYRIHGTHQPWGIGRLISHGCIRLYPEDVVVLYKLVPIGTEVEMVYEPVKIGFKRGRIFIEVHQDIYGKINDLFPYAKDKIKRLNLMDKVDINKVKRAIDIRNGMPMDITK